MLLVLHLSVSAQVPQAAQPRVALAFTAGSGGLGIQLATPLARHFNLRASGSYFSYYGTFHTDGLALDSRLQLRSVNTSLDWFPFHNGFRISPGVTLDNRNNLHASIAVPAGQTFDLGNTTYTSSVGDPVHGTAGLHLGSTVAPSLTVGWGNMIPRNGRRISIPFEVGFQYIGPPTITYDLQGTACDPNNNCGQIQTDPTSLANEQQEQAKINADIRPLRFYPIVSLGFAWAF